MQQQTAECGGALEAVQEREESERQALLLLQRLQDLKTWQSQQEARLLGEHRQEVISLTGDESEDEIDSRDDTTISSMDSHEEELHRDQEDFHRDFKEQEEFFDQGGERIYTKSAELEGVIEEEEERPLSPDNPEDQVVGSGGPGRTFEQLLAQQLGDQGGVDHQGLQGDVDQKNHHAAEGEAPRPKVPRPFLRRGQGLTRFNLPADPKLQPSMVRNKGKPNLDSVESRLAQETQSFANKKTAPEDRHYIPSGKPSPSPTVRSQVSRPSPAHKPPLGGSPSPAMKPATIPISSSASPPNHANGKNFPVSAASGQSPALRSIPLHPSSNPPNRLQLKSPNKPGVSGVSNQGKPRVGAPKPSSLPSPLHNDSVENSFREKLSVQEKKNQKDLKELAVFEMLEDAANDSSFCSTSSRVKTLMNHSILPSPQGKTRFTSSTPAPSKGSSSQMSTPGTGDPTHSTPLDRQSNKSEPSSLDPSLGETLMEDIRNFLKTKQGGPPAGKEEHLASDGEDSEEWTDEEDEADEEESTMRQEEEESIGSDWRERIAGKEREREMNKENREAGERLEFSPPEKMPKNSPSYLIWSIFTKEREERKKRALQLKSPAGQSNTGPGVSGSHKGGVARSAPARPDSRATSQAQPVKEELDYQGTLLHMRVVELEHEIDSFKKETVKVQEIKKRLKTDREKLAQELKEFERLKTEDKKKLDEEKRRLKRDQLLAEKARKEAGGSKCEECADTKTRMAALKEELAKAEATWRKEVARLEEELAKVKQSKLELENENGKLRLKKVGSKIRGRGRNVEVVSHRNREDVDEVDGEGADSGFRTSAGSGSLQESEDDAMDAELRKSISSTIYAALCQGESTESPSLARRDYSTGSSLESSLTLVSATTATTEHEAAIVTDRDRGTREKRFPDGRLEVWYSNGNRKEVSGDKSVTKVFYYNGDVKESHKTGLVRYLYSQTKTWHTTHPDGKEVLQFSNGQEEVRLPDGRMTISFPDGSSKRIAPGGEEEVTFPNGTRVAVKPGGDKVLQLPNGEKEEHTRMWKRRSYPDGTVKILHADGRQETRYAGGRVRVKDSQGNLVQDSANSN